MDLATFIAEVLPEPHSITVEAYAGATGHGDSYAPPATVTPCFVDQKRRLVRDGTGSQVVSQTTVYAPLGTDAPPRSKVTLPDGQETIVISAARRTAAGVDEAPEHLEIACE